MRHVRALSLTAHAALRRHPATWRGILCAAALTLPVLTVTWPAFARFVGGTRPFPDFLSLSYATYYVAPMTCIAPLWVVTRLEGLASLSSRQLVLDGVVFVLSATRTTPVFSLLPLSGHALFLAYTTLTTRDRRYAVLASLALVGTTYLKLIEWRDPITWGMGLVLAAVLARVFVRDASVGA